MARVNRTKDLLQDLGTVRYVLPRMGPLQFHFATGPRVLRLAVQAKAGRKCRDSGSGQQSNLTPVGFAGAIGWQVQPVPPFTPERVGCTPLFWRLLDAQDFHRLA